MRTSTRILTNSFWIGSSELISQIFGIIFTILLARYLGPEEYGKYGFVFAYTALFSIIINFGLWSLIPLEISRDKSLAGKYFFHGVFLKLVASCICIFIIGISLCFMKKTLDVKLMILLIALNFLPTGISGTLGAIFYGYEKMMYPCLAAMISKILTTCFGIYYLLHGYKSITIVIITIIGSIYNTFFLLFFIKKVIPKLEFKINFSFCWQIIKKSFPFLSAGILATYYFKIDMTMLSLMKGNIAVGQYNAAYKIIEGFLFFPSVLMVALFPSMSRLFVQNKKLFQQGFETSFKFLFLLSLIITGAGIVLADKIIILLYKTKYIPSIPAFKILIFTIPFIFINYNFGNFLSTSNKIKIFTIIMFLSLCLNVILNFFLIRKLSFIGASIATVFCEFIITVICFFICIKDLKNLTFFKFIYKPLGIIIVISYLLYIFREINIFVILFFYSIICFVSLWFSGVLSKNETEIIKNFIENTFKKNHNKN
ncbi:MAG: flippase [bacterium]